MLELPAAARLVAWGNAALVGAISLDEAADAVAGRENDANRVGGVPGEDGDVALGYALGRLRGRGVASLRLVLPRPGDIAGLTGPAAFNQAAVEAGEAALGVGADLGLVPAGRGRWIVQSIGPVPPVSSTVRDADRELLAAMREATEELVRLDLARSAPVGAEGLAQFGRPARDALLPPCAPAPAQRLAALAQRLRTALETAIESDGGAVTAGEIALRSATLRDVEVATRRALEAACSAPPG